MANSQSPSKQGDGPTPPRGFLPLNPELMLSPRKQSLAGLIKYQSAPSFNGGSPLKGGRRQSMLPRDEESGAGGDDRNMSPRRRSKRLIGENNPRYNWYVSIHAINSSTQTQWIIMYDETGNNIERVKRSSNI